MKLYGPDGSEMMTITAIEREGSMLVIKGKVFGAMPMTAKVRPSEVRKAFWGDELEDAALRAHPALQALRRHAFH